MCVLLSHQVSWSQTWCPSSHIREASFPPHSAGSHTSLSSKRLSWQMTISVMQIGLSGNGRWLLHITEKSRALSPGSSTGQSRAHITSTGSNLSFLFPFISFVSPIFSHPFSSISSILALFSVSSWFKMSVALGLPMSEVQVHQERTLVSIVAFPQKVSLHFHSSD